MDAAVSAAERAFQEHVGRPDFEVAAMKGHWHLVAVQWPVAYITVQARDGTHWGFRFQLDGYPAQLPNAQPWDVEGNQALPAHLWPKGAGRVAAVFAPHWNPSALYLPCERYALPGHHQWINDHPELLWKPAKGIVHYLEIIHELLASSSYQPPVRPPA